MPEKATIRVEGAWATLHGVPLWRLDECLALDHPQRQYNRAFKEGRWDGKVRLYKGKSFPAGLAEHVARHLTDAGTAVKMVGWKESEPLDCSRFDATYLGKLGPDRDSDLWDHQVEAVQHVLQHKRGVIKSPTGSGKTEMIAAGARYLFEERGWRSLIVMPKVGLMDQTRQRLEDYYGGSPSVGVAGAGIREEGDIIVSTAQTLMGFKTRKVKKKGQKFKVPVPGDPWLKEIVETYEVLWLDEAHHAPSESWYDIALASGALRRYGFSGTPFEDDDEITGLKLIGATGDLLYDVPERLLIDLGLAANPMITMIMSDDASGPELPMTFSSRFDRRTRQSVRYAKPLPYPDAYRQGLIENEHHNRTVLQCAAWFTDRDKQTLILCRRKEHWQKLKDMLEDAGIDHLAVWGQSDLATRNEAKRQLRERATKCVLATTIWDEGEDVPSIEAIVLAEGVKKGTNVLQRIGRGMRRKREGRNEVWIADIVPTCHPKLIEHALKRCEAYERVEYDVQVIDEWSRDPGDEGTLLPFVAWSDELAFAKEAL